MIVIPFVISISSSLNFDSTTLDSAPSPVCNFDSAPARNSDLDGAVRSHDFLYSLNLELSALAQCKLGAVKDYHHQCGDSVRD
ncbi:hypothetical protein EVAR_50330_1 [Eumeta japonica]|uniref:Uncharacterized protein n=1 Tax=Eumeta variegata TaxID=151549 RepID=A0A4C1XQG1_EUMVA|nr:hypothetical protein EVAR_50330_1 [Eumeta japonica]